MVLRGAPALEIEGGDAVSELTLTLTELEIAQGCSRPSKLGGGAVGVFLQSER